MHNNWTLEEKCRGVIKKGQVGPRENHLGFPMEVVVEVSFDSWPDRHGGWAWWW